MLAGMFIVFLGHGFLFSFSFYLERQEYEKTKRAFNCIVLNYEIDREYFENALNIYNYICLYIMSIYC